MHEEDIKKLVASILQADRTVHIQQLGLPWVPPEENQSTTFGASNIGSVERQNIGFEQSPGEGDEENLNVKTYLIDKLSNDGTKENLIRILLLLKQEAAFLIEEKLEESIALGTVNETEAFDLRNNSILQSLGITSVDHMELLIDFFYFYGVDVEENYVEMMRGESRDLEFNPDETIEVMESFIDELQTRIANKSDNITINQNQNEPRKTKKSVGNFGFKQQTEKERKEKQMKQEEDQWIKMSDMIPDQKVKTWKALDR